MERRNRIEKIVGICYLILAIAFCIMFFIAFSFLPKSAMSSTELVEEARKFGFAGIWVAVNILLSLLVGLVLIFNKDANLRIIRLSLVFASILVFLDVVPISIALFEIISKGLINMPWSILIFGIHVYLLFSLLAIRKDLKDGSVLAH